MTFDQAAARALIGSYHPNFVLPYEIRELKAALAEIEQLQKIISEPVESFGTPELIAWARKLQQIIDDFPENEYGNWPFVLEMGSHLEKFAKGWNSPTIEEQAKRIAELEGAAKADEGRLIAAAKKAGIEYFGCDTPDHLADRVAELEKALVEERAATVAYENNMQLCECKESAFCQARQQLHREGLL